MKRQLVLRRDTLAELATAELEAVLGAQYMTGPSRALIHCDSILLPCSTGCGQP